MVHTVTGVTWLVRSKAFTVAAVLAVLAATAAALLITTASGASAAATFVQGAVFNHGGTSGSLSVWLSRPVNEGDLLVGWFAQYGSAGNVQVSDGINGTWTRAPDTEQFGGTKGDIALYYLADSKAAAGGIAITVSARSGADLQGTVAEYSGITTSSPLSTMAVSRGSGTVVTTGTTSPVPAGQLVYAAEITGMSPAAAAAPGTSQGIAYTRRDSAASRAAFTEDITSGAAGTQTGAATLPTATDWYAVVATFKPGARTSPSPASTPSTPSTPSTKLSPSGTMASRISKVLVITEENRNSVDVFPSASRSTVAMPYLWSLAKEYGYATNWSDIGHPSLPNYLAIFGGRAEGLPDDCAPGHGCSWPGPTVFSQAIAAGGTARVYEEGMTANCQASNPGYYDVNHNPWVYYTDPTDKAECRSNDVPAGTPHDGALRSDIKSGALPTVGLLKPNLANDTSNGTFATADNWLRSWIPVIQSGPDWKAGRLAIVVTCDEGDQGGENVPFVLIARGVHGVVVTTALNHYALTRFLDEVSGASLLGNAGTQPDIAPLFGVRLTPVSASPANTGATRHG
jgi:phosphatidylinositol-3-phosphatase